MTNVEEIEKAILRLTDEEKSKLRIWFRERDWEEWDREIERDSEAGRLDFLLQEATSSALINMQQPLSSLLTHTPRCQ